MIYCRVHTTSLHLPNCEAGVSTYGPQNGMKRAQTVLGYLILYICQLTHYILDFNYDIWRSPPLSHIILASHTSWIDVVSVLLSLSESLPDFLVFSSYDVRRASRWVLFRINLCHPSIVWFHMRFSTRTATSFLLRTCEFPILDD